MGIESKFNRTHGYNIRDIAEKLELVGEHEAIVVENEDEEGLGRITVKIPHLYDDEPVTGVMPKFPTYTFSIPKPGMYTYVSFKNLDENLPIWSGSWYPQDFRHPDMDGNPKRHIKQIINNDGEKILTIAFEEETFLLIKDDVKGSLIQYDITTGEIFIRSDTAENNTAPVYINGTPIDGALPAARQFDETEHLCPVIGIPVKGMITKGCPRVKLSPVKPLF